MFLLFLNLYRPATVKLKYCHFSRSVNCTRSVAIAVIAFVAFYNINVFYLVLIIQRVHHHVTLHGYAWLYVFTVCYIA